MSGYKVIVIGSGVAGLSAAAHLAERGLEPLVLEADERFIGGRLAGGETIEVNGHAFRMEHGVHGIWGQYRNLRAMLERYGITPTLTPAKEEAWIYKDRSFMGMAPVGSAIRNTIIPPPFHYLQLILRAKFLRMLSLRDWLSIFHVWSGLVMAVGIDPFAENQPMEGLTLGGLTRKWSPALRSFLLGLSHNGLSGHPDEVSISGFIAFLRFYTLMRRDAWEFSYLPEDGGTSICDPLGAKVNALGGRIRLGSSVKRVVRRDEEWLVTIETAEGEETLSAEQVILATDPYNAKKILKQSFGAEVDALFFPDALSNAVARLWFDANPHVDSEAGIFTGDFTAHNYFWLHRLYAPYKKWSRETGGSALEAHVYGPPETLALPDAALLARVIADVQQAFPQLRGHRVRSYLQRNAKTHTVPAVGAKEKYLGIETKWKNLFCAGDWVRHEAPCFFLERACMTGIEAANAVLDSRGLEKFERLHYLPPEPFVAWIETLMRRGRKNRRERKESRIV